VVAEDDAAVKIEQTGVIDLFQQGPLCPQSMPPVHAAHAAMVRVQNAAYDAIPKDGDGELREDFDPVYSAIAYGDDSRMRLYRDAVEAMSTRGTVTVESLYFRCPVCGLILPASRMG